MMTQTLLSLDFGSEYIRVAKTRYDSDQPRSINPQLVEFDGRRALRNVILLTPDYQHWQAIGEDALTSDNFHETPELIQHGLALDSDPASELGRPVDSMLKHIANTVGLRQVSPEALSTWQTLIAVPTSSGSGTATRWEARLRQAGFPAPRALDAMAAVLATHELTTRPGLYLVVDLGAGYIRIAVYKVADSLDLHLQSVKCGGPGGREFDLALLQYFNQRLNEATIGSSSGQLELNYFVEQFKRQFSQALADGQEIYQASYPMPPVQGMLTLGRADFESTALAGELIKDFRSIARRVLDEGQIAAENLDGIVLSGGGAHWPFVKAWAAELVDADKIYCGEYPEESAVKGLAQIAAADIHITKSLPSPPGPAPRPLPPSPPPTPPPSPAKAFWVEFLGGLVGILGLGWFFVLKRFVGCAALLGWWVVIAVTVAIGGGLSVATVNPLTLLLIVPVWLLGPLLSAVLAYRSARQANRKESN